MRTSLLAMLVGALALSTASAQERPGFDLTQVPTWSHEDMDFFLHGSMSTEVVPERVLKAFMATYPDLFHGNDLSTFGLIPDAAGGWPRAPGRAWMRPDRPRRLRRPGPHWSGRRPASP